MSYRAPSAWKGLTYGAGLALLGVETLAIVFSAGGLPRFPASCIHKIDVVWTWVVAFLTMPAAIYYFGRSRAIFWLPLAGAVAQSLLTFAYARWANAPCG